VSSATKRRAVWEDRYPVVDANGVAGTELEEELVQAFHVI
jgi:hypothetical protein